jgi:hypothetical protein
MFTGNIRAVNSDRPLLNTYWVVPNRLLAGEYPGDADETEARSRLARLHAAGIHRFLDLTEEGELRPYRDFLKSPTDHDRCAIADCSVPTNVAQTRKALATIRAALAEGRGLYVHCRAGIGRTGLIVGCYLAEELSSGKAALKQLNTLWRQSERSAAWPKVPQTAEQADYVRHWIKFSRRPTQRSIERGPNVSRGW